MLSYSTMEDELSCDAWLALSTDFIGGTRGPPFWEQVHEKFHARKHIAPYDVYIMRPHNMRSLSYHWHAIQVSAIKYYNLVAHGHEGDGKFYFLLLNLLIDSFTQCWSTHYM